MASSALTLGSGPAVAAAVGQTAVNSPTSVVLTAKPNPSTYRQSVTFTAAVSAGAGHPIGAVVFSIDGKLYPPVLLSVVKGVDRAVFTDAKLTPGTHKVAAGYLGGLGYLTSVSAPVVQRVVSVPGPNATAAPTVQRFGIHNQATTLVLQFDAPLDPTSATNVKNYVITGPYGGATIPVVTAKYNKAAMTVTLQPLVQLSLHASYKLKIVGTGATGIKDVNGTPLGSAGGTAPGKNYTTTITAANLVQPG